MTGAAELYLVPVAQKGGIHLLLFNPNELSILPHLQQDGTTVAAVQIPVGRGRVVSGNVKDGLMQALDEAALATAAYLLGLAQRAFEITLDYLKQRQQSASRLRRTRPCSIGQPP